VVIPSGGVTPNSTHARMLRPVTRLGETRSPVEHLELEGEGRGKDVPNNEEYGEVESRADREG
jgi:hypothetical protein